MRKLVVTLLVTLAAFTFLRDYPSTRSTETIRKPEFRSALIP
jgi:hypothetical protein